MQHSKKCLLQNSSLIYKKIKIDTCFPIITDYILIFLLLTFNIMISLRYVNVNCVHCAKLAGSQVNITENTYNHY